MKQLVSCRVHSMTANSRIGTQRVPFAFVVAYMRWRFVIRVYVKNSVLVN